MEISRTTEYLINKFKENPLTNTIVIGKESEIDHNKSNIYPLVNIDIVQSEIIDLTGSITHRINYNINILQQRDLPSKLNLDNKLLNTNMVDNLNETYVIATKAINNIRSYHNDLDIEVYSVTPIQMVKYSGTNLLDGVYFNIVLEIPDSTGC